MAEKLSGSDARRQQPRGTYVAPHRDPKLPRKEQLGKRRFDQWNRKPGQRFK